LHEGFKVLAEAVDQIRLYSEERSVVTVCAEPLFATKWIVPRLHHFYARYPEAEVRLQASLHSVDQVRGGGFGVSQLKRAGIDVAVRLGYGDYDDLDPQRLMHLDLVPMSKPGLASASGIMELLKTNPMLSDGTLAPVDDLCGWREWFRQLGGEHSASFKSMKFGNGLLALEAAVSGQGILLGSKELLLAELDAGKLDVLIDRPIRCAQAYYVVSCGFNIERPIAREFREWLIDEAKAAEA
jgi:LysR family glycine cleavage system transcriptional activator